MDALLLLTGDHNRCRGLFARFQQAHESDDQAMAQVLAKTIIRELEVHTEIEETTFYPAVQDLNDEVHELVVEGLEEHAVVKDLIAEVKGIEPSDEHWPAKMKVIIENVEHHADEEEKEMFPLIQKAMDAERLESLAKQLEAKKRSLGAPTTDKTIDLTKAELVSMAKEQQIPGRSKMSQEELAASVAPQ
jgi:hemerythrin superfamily protein